MTEHDDLQRLFADATAEVHPQGTFHDIETRIAQQDPGARRWFLPVVAAAAVMALAIGGAFYATRDDGKAAQPSGHGGVTVGESEHHDLIAFYAGPTANGRGLFRESVSQETPVTLQEALAQAASGTPVDGDYQTLWPATTTISKAGWTEADDGTRVSIRVTLDGPLTPPAGMSERDAFLAVAALVRTAHAWTPPGPADDWADLPVEFYAEHSGGGAPPLPLNEVFGVAAPFTGGDDADVLAPVQIQVPTNGQKVAAGGVLKVRGLAATFEANVVWELLRGGEHAGTPHTVVRQGHTTAKEGGVLSEYAFTIEGLEAGTYTLVVHDTDESGENRPTNQDTKEIVVE